MERQGNLEEEMNIYVFWLIGWFVGVNGALFLLKEARDSFPMSPGTRIICALVWPFWAALFFVLNVFDGIRGMVSNGYE
jgi:hypothetical protein